MPCKECNDTGVVETGNNDFPCFCPAGDKALFNVAGVAGKVRGSVLKKAGQGANPQSMETVVKPPADPPKTRTGLEILQQATKEKEDKDREFKKLIAQLVVSSLQQDFAKAQKIGRHLKSFYTKDQLDAKIHELLKDWR